jgi:hypothetical protein
MFRAYCFEIEWQRTTFVDFTDLENGVPTFKQIGFFSDPKLKHRGRLTHLEQIRPRQGKQIVDYILSKGIQPPPPP